MDFLRTKDGLAFVDRQGELRQIKDGARVRLVHMNGDHLFTWEDVQCNVKDQSFNVYIDWPTIYLRALEYALPLSLDTEDAEFDLVEDIVAADPWGTEWYIVVNARVFTVYANTATPKEAPDDDPDQG